MGVPVYRLLAVAGALVEADRLQDVAVGRRSGGRVDDLADAPDLEFVRRDRHRGVPERPVGAHDQLGMGDRRLGRIGEGVERSEARRLVEHDRAGAVTHDEPEGCSLGTEVRASEHGRGAAVVGRVVLVGAGEVIDADRVRLRLRRGDLAAIKLKAAITKRLCISALPRHPQGNIRRAASMSSMIMWPCGVTGTRNNKRRAARRRGFPSTAGVPDDIRAVIFICGKRLYHQRPTYAFSRLGVALFGSPKVAVSPYLLTIRDTGKKRSARWRQKSYWTKWNERLMMLP